MNALPFLFRINPLSLVEIIAIVIEQYKNKKEAVEFLEKIQQKVKSNSDAENLCKVIFKWKCKILQLVFNQMINVSERSSLITILKLKKRFSCDRVFHVHVKFCVLALYISCSLHHRVPPRINMFKHLATKRERYMLSCHVTWH